LFKPTRGWGWGLGVLVNGAQRKKSSKAPGFDRAGGSSFMKVYGNNLIIYFLLDVFLSDPAEILYINIMTLCEVETQRTNNSDIGEKLPEY
jgi:hypothetical protein